MLQLVYRIAAVLIIVACAFLLWLFFLQGEAHGTASDSVSQTAADHHVIGAPTSRYHR